MRPASRLRATKSQHGRLKYRLPQVLKSTLVTHYRHLTKFRVGPTPNFITEIFFLASAISHYGLNRTLQSYDDLHKEMEDVQRHIDFLNSSLNALPTSVRRLAFSFLSSP